MISQWTNQVAVHTGSSWNSSIRSSVGISSAGRGRMNRASAPTSRVSASIQRPSSYPSSSKRAEKVVTGVSLSCAATAVTEPESSPPLNSVATGTSARRRIATASRNVSRKRSSASSSVSDSSSRDASSAQKRRSWTFPSASIRHQCPLGKCSIPA